MVRARLFGSIVLELGDRVLGARDFGGVKPKQILEILLCERGRPVSKERLADLLWGDALPANVSATLETYVSVLRRQLGQKKDGLVLTEPGAYRVDTSRLWVDLDELDACVARGDRPALDEALALVRGEVLADEPYASWALRLREVYRERHLRALLLAARLAAQAGDHAAAAARAAEAAALDPACEPAHRAAMTALHALGRDDEAMRAFQRCRTALREELGVDPQPETIAVRDRIRGRPDEPPPPRRAVPPRDVPFLGRRDDLDLLERAARAALAGAPALLLVEGEAGIGKSRILQELSRRLAPTRVAHAKCFPLDADLPFAPLAALVRQLAPPADWPDLGEILPERSGSGGELARGRALESVVRLVVEQAPLMLILDDAQWADASSLAALDYLRRRGGDGRFLVVCSFRSEAVGPEHAVRRMGASVHLELTPLSVADLGDAELHARTGGNALFVVECLRAAADGSEGVPPSLRELILARSRAAGPEAHRLLATASVLGRSFDPDVLASLVGADDVSEGLELLCERRLLRSDGARFDFRHDVLRETLAESLSPTRRRRLHAQVTELLVNRAADPGEIAAHAEAAGDPAHAARLSLAAGDAARARFANTEAAAHYGRALRLAEAHAEMVEPALIELLLIRTGQALTPLRRHAEAEAQARRALALAEARGDDGRALDALELISKVRQFGASDGTGSLEWARRALVVAERIGDPAALARAHALVGSPSGTLGMIDDAIRHSREALAQAEKAGLPAPAHPMGRLALMMHMRADPAEALDWTRRCEEAALGQRDEQSLVMARWIRALSLAARGQTSEAWRTLDSIADVGYGEESFWRARVPNTYGSFLADLGLWDRALERDLESLENARRRDLPQVKEAEIHTMVNLAADRLALGKLSEARADIEWVRRQSCDYARFRWLARMHVVDAELALAEDDAERARMAAEACLLLAEKHGQPKHVVRARIAAARALAELDRRGPARKQALAAAQTAEAHELPHLAWRAWDLAGDADKARAAVRRVAAGLDEPLRRDFLRVVPVRP